MSNAQITPGGPMVSLALTRPGDAPSLGANPGAVVFDIKNASGTVVLTGSVHGTTGPYSINDTSGHAWSISFPEADGSTAGGRVVIGAPAVEAGGVSYEIRCNGYADTDGDSAFFYLVAASGPTAPTEMKAPEGYTSALIREAVRKVWLKTR